MLRIVDLSIKVSDNTVLNSFSLTLASGEVCALVGPNGSGKSSLAYAIAGHPAYEVTSGDMLYAEQNIVVLASEQRAKKGFFLVPQQIIGIPAVQVARFLYESYRSLCSFFGTYEEFCTYIKPLFTRVGLSHDFLGRGLYEGFSGGEKKRLELVQLLLVRPRVVVLDEIDAGLDADALMCVLSIINELKADNPSMIILVITHSCYFLRLLHPLRVVVMSRGTIAYDGDMRVIDTIESFGYAEYDDKGL